MDKIDKLKRDQAEEMAALIVKEKIRALLPESIRETSSIIQHADHWTVVGWRGFDAAKQRKFSQAVKVVEEMQDQIVESEHWKSNSSVSCRPMRINGNEKYSTSVMDGASAVEIDVMGGRGFHTTEVRFWAEIGQQFDGGVEVYLISVHLPVEDLGQLSPSVRSTYTPSGDLKECEITWPMESRVVDSFRKWWSERPSYHGTYYLADWHNFNSWAGTITAPALHGNYCKGVAVK